MGPTDGRCGPPYVRWVLRLLIAIVLLYTCHRALVLRVEYFDGYTYLANARRILGDPLARYDRIRPPLLTILELPAMAIVRASAPGSVVRIIAPHCMAALISMASAAAVLWTFRLVFSRGFALLGALFFVASRYFVHYGAFVMADIVSAGCAAATVGAYLTARKQRGFAAYALAGVAFGAALLAKFPLGGLAPALLVTEAWYAVNSRRFDSRRWLGLALLGATSVALFVSVQALLLSIALGRKGLDVLLSTFDPRALLVTVRFAHVTESWQDWVGMAPAMLGPTFALAVGGLGIALVQRQERDVPFLAWLALLGGGIVFGIARTESRYLLPVVPAIIYFAVRTVEAAVAWLDRERVRAAWRRSMLQLGGAALLIAVLAPGVRQAWRDRDPVFFSDVERRAALGLLEQRTPRGRLVWNGSWFAYRFSAHDRIPKDETFGVFSFAPFIAEYFIDQRVTVLPGLPPVAAADLLFSPLLQDGDAVLLKGKDAAAAAPLDDPFEIEVWAVRRMTLVRDGDRFVSMPDPTLSLEREALGNGEYSIRAQADIGRWSVLAVHAAGAEPRRYDEITFEAGRPVSLGPGSADVDRLILTSISRTMIR